MDTRQLAAFCAVVERRSFSQAADQLGVSQPAVSLQIRSLEQRLGQQLLDRSGRRVEPTEAGARLYRGAQRLLALEQQLLAELGEQAEGELAGRLEIGASTGPGGSVLPRLLGEFRRLQPRVQVALTVSDTHTVVEQVARREVELGVVGAAVRQRGVVFEPFYRDEVVLAVPAGHRRAGASLTLEELKAEPLVLMQEGAGIRQIIDDELRGLGLRLRDLNVGLELGLQESARAAVLAGFGATFISRIAIENDLAAGTLAVVRVEGLEPAREVQLVRASGRAETRAARAFVAYAREQLGSQGPPSVPAVRAS
jgi:DNA-binding transcriptional LysR family regulator